MCTVKRYVNGRISTNQKARLACSKRYQNFSQTVQCLEYKGKDSNFFKVSSTGPDGHGETLRTLACTSTSGRQPLSPASAEPPPSRRLLRTGTSTAETHERLERKREDILPY
eukprot:6213758-Pleurochrysis_carterae.AAC.1